MAKRQTRNEEDVTQGEGVAGDTYTEAPPAQDNADDAIDEAPVPEGMVRVRVGKMAFLVTAKFSEGHVLTPVEARFTSARWVDAVRNGLYEDFKTLRENDAAPEAYEAMFNEAYASYIPFSRNTGPRAVDPVEDLANKLAWADVEAQLKKRNLKTNTIKADVRKELTAKMRAGRTARNGDVDPYAATAQAQIAAAEEVDLDLSVLG